LHTKDEKVGQIDILGRQVLYSHFVNEVNAALAPNGYKSDIQDYYDNKATPESCKAAVDALHVEPEDIIVFYYIGHGARPNTDAGYMMEHPYPQMCMCQSDENKFIPLEWVNKTLSSKGARLCVTIGMCCNSLANISIKDGPNFSPNYGATYIGSNKMQRIQELFLNVKGNVLATSASPAQTSGCFKSDFGVMDCYTTVLCDIFSKTLDSYSKTLTWDDLLNVITTTIDDKTNGDQTPIYETHLSEAQTPVKKVPQIPTQKQIQTTQQQQTAKTVKQQGQGEGDDKWINELTNGLGSLINVSVGEYDRIQASERLAELFADDAQVKILAEDGNAVIDKEDANIFLGRLATSRLLLKVAVMEGAFDDNSKIKTLKVREIYKK
jgi:hypothetical protein